VSVLGIPKKGKAILLAPLDGHNNGHNITAEYFKSSDKRIRFKSGWEVFAAKNNLVAGIGALIMFHMTRRGLMISFDIVHY
jgi:hypothetical protein